MELATAPAAARQPFRLSDCPYDDHWQGYVLGRDATHRYLWIWQGSNIRMIAVSHDEDGLYEHGWCFPRDPRAVEAAAAAWDPDVQDEPNGWHKRPTWPVRRAPRRDEQPQYNRPRCEHGCYIAEGCRTINCRDHRDRGPA
jgi:hypothetical protein